MDLYQELLDGSYSQFISDDALFMSEIAYNTRTFKNESTSNIEKVIHKINVQLNTGKSKKSLHLLLSLLPQCSTDLLKKYGEKWFKMCFTQLESKNMMFKPALCLVLVYLVKASESVADLQKNIGKSLRESPLSNCIPKLIDEGEYVECKLNLLYELLRVYPGSLLTHTTYLEKRALNYISKPFKPHGDDLAYDAGKVYCALKGANIEKLLSLGHIALDSIFENVMEMEDYTSLIDERHFGSVDALNELKELDNPIRKMFVASTCIGNIFTFIVAFLRCCSAGTVTLNPRAVLGLPLRVIGVDLTSVKKLKGREHVHLVSLLPSLHQRALKHIEDLLQIVGACFDLLSGLLLDSITLIVHTNTPPRHDSGSKRNKLYSDETRLRAYECLYSYVQVYNGCFPMPLNLCSTLIWDITPKKEGLRLRKIRGQSLSSITVRKKGKKKGYTAEPSESSAVDDDKIVFTSGPKIVKAALKLVSKWIELGQHSLPLKCLEDINGCLLSLTPLPLIGAYSLPEVRGHYFECLISVATYPHPSCPPNYSKINNALSAGVLDCDQNVSSICKRGLGTLSFILTNPQISVFNAYVSLREKKTQREEVDIEDSDSDLSGKENEDSKMNGTVSDSDAMEIDEDRLEDDAEDKKVERNDLETDLHDESIVPGIYDISSSSKLNLDTEKELNDNKHTSSSSESVQNCELVNLDDEDSNSVEILGTTVSDGVDEISMEKEAYGSHLIGKDRGQKVSKKKKRKLDQKEESTNEGGDEEERAADIEAMLTSFVDADPDSE